MFEESKLSQSVVESPEHYQGIMDELSKIKNPSLFSLRTRALKSGRTDTVLAATPSQWIWLKCYACGGENALHAHANEDHTFIILQGTALFHGPNGVKQHVTANQGVCIPAGNVYSFTVVSEDNLLMLRIGSPTGEGDPGHRTNEKGEPLDAFIEAKTTLKNMAKPVFDDHYNLEPKPLPENS